MGFQKNSDITIAIGLSNNYRNIGLQLSDWQHWTSDSPIAIRLTEIYRTKNREFFTIFFTNFSPFCRLFCEFPRNTDFLASILCCWCPCWCYCWYWLFWHPLWIVSLLLLTSFCCWQVSTISGILAIACLPSAVDVRDVSIVSAPVA